MDETVCRVWLSGALTPGSACAKLFDQFDSAEDVWHASSEELKLAGAGDALIRRLENRDLAEAARIAGFAERYGVSIVTLRDAAYPDLLRGIPNPPYLLYVLGRLPDFEKTLSVGVVGTRRMTEYGMERAYRVSYELAAAGVCVISGLARGIDGVAATAAIEAGGTTVAVLGCGLDTVYPPEHRPLMAAVAKNGAVISEYPPGTPPAARNFPVRNRIISGLSRGVYVVEAGAESGAVLTAAEARRQGRAVFALPGRAGDPESEGTNRLLCEGARAATDACDLLEFFRDEFPSAINGDAYARATCTSDPDAEALAVMGVLLPGQSRGKPERRTAVRKERPVRTEVSAKPEPARPPKEEKLPEDERLRRFLELVPPGERVCADSFAGHGYGTFEAMNLLSILEISGFLTSVPGGMYVRN